jgi:hypothetical protein
MPGSVTSVFSEPDDFQATLHEDGVFGMLVTGGSPFRARLTQITPHRLRLSVRPQTELPVPIRWIELPKAREPCCVHLASASAKA